MRVSVDISAEYNEPYAIIYTDKVTDEIQHITSENEEWL